MSTKSSPVSAEKWGRGWHITELEEEGAKQAPPRYSSFSALLPVLSPDIQKFLKQPFFFSLPESLPYPIPKTRGKNLVYNVKINVKNLSVPTVCQA